MEHAFAIENTRERERLVTLIGRLNDNDFIRDAGRGWTVSVVFAHLPLCKAIPPRVAANLAIVAAEAVDRELEQLPVQIVEAIEAMGDIRRIRRSMHRSMHLDQIEAILSG